MILLFTGGYVLFNRQYVADTAVSYSYQPSREMLTILNDIQLTEEGMFYAQVGRPVLSSQSEFNTKCEKKHAESLILGCYISPYNVYVYNVDDQKLQSVRQVTTAHEVLHVAYDRLTQHERSEIDGLVSEAAKAAQRDNPELSERLAVYDQTEPGQRNNELHSIIGTEVAKITPELEEYYARYFKDRQKIIAYATEYTEVFNSLKKSQESLETKLETLKVEINENTDQYNSEITQLNQDIETFNNTASTQGGFRSESEYTVARAELVARQNNLESMKNSINEKIQEYNRVRDQLRALNIEADELNSSLDSTKNPSI